MKALSILLYGCSTCEDTEMTRDHLRASGIAFREIDINQDAEAERVVIALNDGFRSTPTMVIGAGKLKVILTEPTNADLDHVLAHVSEWVTLNPDFPS